MTLRIGVAAHLIEHRALHVENAPIRVIRLVRAIEGGKRLLVLAGEQIRAQLKSQFLQDVDRLALRR